MEIHKFAGDYVNRLKQVIDAFDLVTFEKIVRMMLEAYARGSHIFIMGNGGSGSTASHMACDINKGCCIDLEKKFKMLCLNDNVPTMLALANDISYEAVFEEQLKNFFNPKDMVIGISGSGNSKNILRAIRYAADNGGKTVGWSGLGGGKLSEMVDLAFVVDSDDMQHVEDAHMVVAHMMMKSIWATLHHGAPKSADSSGRCPI